MKSMIEQSLITYEELRLIIEKMEKSEFTVLDINKYIYDNYRDLHNELVRRYAETKNYSHLNYLSNLLCNYSNKDYSILQIHNKYDKYKENNPDFRQPSDEEKIIFKSDNIAVFRCEK